VPPGHHQRRGPPGHPATACATISAEIESGSFDWKLDLEDVHLNIEARLTQLVGDAGKRLHTGRSRNDQVATDVRLWLRDEIDLIDGLLTDLQKALLEVADKNVDVILPGFTHLQVAQPVSFGHHMLAYVEMFARDAERMAGRAPARQPPAAGRRRAGRHQLPAGPRARGHPRWAWWMTRPALRVPEQPGRRERPRLRHRIHRRSQPVHGAHQPPERRADFVDEPELRLLSRLPTASPPAVPSCRRRRTPMCPNSRAARPAAWSAT
jgi:hypothetical protein